MIPCSVDILSRAKDTFGLTVMKVIHRQAMIPNNGAKFAQVEWSWLKVLVVDEPHQNGDAVCNASSSLSATVGLLHPPLLSVHMLLESEAADAQLSSSEPRSTIALD